MPRHIQVNITLTPEQKAFVIESHEKGIPKREIARQLGETYNKVVNNMRMMGLHRRVEAEFLPDFDNGKGYFDLDKWAKCYSV